MVQKGNIYTAEEGKIIVRKSDNFIMGKDIDLGIDDSINNYQEIDEPEEESDSNDSEIEQQDDVVVIAKSNKLARLLAYDRSSNVNNFTLNRQPMWLTVSERQQLATQIEANETIGRTEMARWFNGIEFTFPIAVWKQMLTALEVYAGDAFNVTERHKAAINALTTKEEVNNYDYTVGYPTKLAFGESENILEP